jgi:ADP-ribose pyrophosphatase YjhB (NUDIX family)
MKLLKIFDKRSKKLGHQPIIYKDAVRAIILKKGRILLVFSEEAEEFKFPGGGVRELEGREPALRRKVQKELGLEVNSINESLGYVDQIYNDIYDEKKYFFLRSYYYFCELFTLDFEPDFHIIEKGYKFVPIWVTIDEAIKINQLKHDNGSEYNWTERELYVLKLLKEMMQ